MTAPVAYAPAEPDVHRADTGTVNDVVVAVIVVVGLAVVGAVAGLVWMVWTPARPPAQILGGGQYIPDETEAFIAGDGRFLVVTAVIGLGAALLAWFTRRHNRGVAVSAALVVGGLVGAALTELVGHLTGGGSAAGRVVTASSGQQFRLTQHLPLSVHTSGLLMIEAAVAVLVYGMFAAFTVHDDLGHPDPVRDRVQRAAAPPTTAPPMMAPPSVDAGGHPQYGWGYGDAAGPAQQGDLPPQ